MSPIRLFFVTFLALLAFAGNSVLCRLALVQTNIDAASFTTIRLLAGAIVLWGLVLRHRQPAPQQGSWLAALLLFTYAAGFSFAYLQLDTGMGALLLFGAVQLTMVGYGLLIGERFSLCQWFGFMLAVTGLIGLMLPGVTSPSIEAASLMLLAGFAWGWYSILGKRATQPLRATADNFVRAVPLSILLSVLFMPEALPEHQGIIYAVLSGALTSGIGYAIWYSVLPQLKASTSSTVQLSVPLLTAVAGIVLLQELLNLRLLLAAIAILCGIALVVLNPLRGKS